MKNIIYALAIVFTLTGCVQETTKQTVTVFLDVSDVKNIKTVGIRGDEKPFSWDYDMEMEVVKKDSLYKKTFNVNTGRLCTEIKFTVNDEFELKDQDNRKVYFDKSKTTVYKAKYNQIIK